MTVLSESVKNLYPKFVQKKMIVMPNPVYIYPEKIERAELDPTRKIILNVGRLSDQKDQVTLIESFSMIADKYPEWDVRIVGEGENKNKLKDLIEEKNLTTRVHLVGTTNQIAKEYIMAQIFAMPSKYESFGLATAEAMSFSIPSIGFEDCPGTNEIINKGNGILVKAKNNRIQNFANALDILISKPKLRIKLGHQAKKDIIKYQPSIIVERWENLINTTLSNDQKP